MKLTKLVVLLLASAILAGCSYKTTLQKVDEITEKYPNSEFHQINVYGHNGSDDHWIVRTTNNITFYVFFNEVDKLTSIPIFNK